MKEDGVDSFACAHVALLAKPLACSTPSASALVLSRVIALAKLHKAAIST